MKIKYVFPLISLVSLLTLVLPAKITEATYQDPLSGAALGAMVTVSKNNTNWDNYSNTSSITPTGQTLVVKPGDTVYFKGEVWNASNSEGGPAANPLVIAVIKNAKYLEDIDLFSNSNADLDGNGINYQALPGPPIPNEEGYEAFGLSFSAALQPKGPLGPGNIPESGMITAKIKSDVPSGTVIEGVFAMAQPMNQFAVTGGLIKNAMADALTDAVDRLPEQSHVRLLVSTPATVLTLPKTGSSVSKNQNFPVIGIVAIVGALIGIGAIKIKKFVAEKIRK